MSAQEAQAQAILSQARVSHRRGCKRGCEEWRERAKESAFWGREGSRGYILRGLAGLKGDMPSWLKSAGVTDVQREYRRLKIPHGLLT